MNNVQAQDIAIRTQSVTKIYGNNTVVSKVSMNIHKGDIYGFIGSNGAGKTTFIRCLMGLANVTSGQVEILGKSGKDIVKARKKVGCIVESPAIMGNLNAYDCIKNHALLYYNRVDKKKLMELIEFVGLGQTGNKKVKDFSLGMRQRMAIAQTLVNDPQVLILDEPTNGMDPQGIVEMREFLHMLRDTRGLTILISSHILGELQQLANRFGIIDKGVLVDEFTKEELALKQSGASTIKIEVQQEHIAKVEELLAQILDSESYKIRGTEVDIVNDDNFIKANRAIITSGVDIKILSKSQANLEQYFIDKVGVMYDKIIKT